VAPPPPLLPPPLFAPLFPPLPLRLFCGSASTPKMPRRRSSRRLERRSDAILTERGLDPKEKMQRHKQEGNEHQAVRQPGIQSPTKNSQASGPPRVERRPV
jgi:hypothetical protein